MASVCFLTECLFFGDSFGGVRKKIAENETFLRKVLANQ